MLVVALIWTLLHLPLHGLLVRGQDWPLCITRIKVAKGLSYFQVGHKPLRNTELTLIVYPDSPNECFVNTTEVVERMDLRDEVCDRSVAVLCFKPKLVRFLPYEATKYNDVIFFLQFSNCASDPASILTMASLVNLKFVTFLPGSMQTAIPVDAYNVSYEHLNTVVGISVLHDGRYSGSVLDMFNTSKVYPDVAEIDLRNMSRTTFSENLDEMFPNLQSLESVNSALSQPPQAFPWTNHTKLLPDNLSRTAYMQDHYSSSEFLGAPANEFRRILNLDGNNFSDLSNFTFSGYLQKISLARSEIHSLGSDLFVNVRNMKNIDLSYNNIHHLPAGLFRHQSDLRNLDLSNNKISTLAVSDFIDLRQLEKLNLANNSLESLPEGVFTHLKELKKLHLENNSLVSLDPASFPVDSLKLVELHLQYNPVKVLPEFVFWIRGLKLANFKGSQIDFENFTEYILNLHTNNIGHSVIDSGADSDTSDLKTQSDNPALIDLSDCQISSLSLSTTQFGREFNVLLVILLHFRFDLTGNPLRCDCRINNFTQYVQSNIRNGTIKNEDTLFKSWKCVSPSELMDKQMISVPRNATYCPVDVENCPSRCTCHRRSVIENIIVDCRGIMLTEIDRRLPEGRLELWYSFNNLTTLVRDQAFENVVHLDVSHNKLQSIDTDMFLNMRNLRYLDLRSNLLAILPASVTTLHAETVLLVPNPFKCDCNTRWTKSWFLNNKNVVKDWNEATCSTEDTDGHVFVELDDELFICKTTEFDELKHVVLPSIVCSVLGVMCVAILIVIYTFRLEVKVLLFIYFGIHPFDDDDNYVQENIDCVIVHSGHQTDWVMERLVSMLENVSFNFVVCDMARDFVVGYSFQENLTKTVSHSKRMLFLISQDWKPVSESFAVAWGIAQAKMKETRSNFGIIVTHEIERSDIEDKDVRLFMKRGRYVDSSEKLFEDKVLYYMPLKKGHGFQKHDKTMLNVYRPADVMTRCFINEIAVTDEIDAATEMDANREDVDKPIYDAFVSYAEDDFDYALREIVPILDERGLRCCIPDRDFVIGASKEENILNSIVSSVKTIFIISPSHVFDEWSLFTFRAAYEKSLREKTNHLIVIIKDNTDIDADIQDEEMKHYVRNYICLHQTDKWFENKLLNSLMMVTYSHEQVQQEHKTAVDEHNVVTVL